MKFSCVRSIISNSDNSNLLLPRRLPLKGLFNHRFSTATKATMQLTVTLLTETRDVIRIRVSDRPVRVAMKREQAQTDFNNIAKLLN